MVRIEWALDQRLGCGEGCRGNSSHLLCLPLDDLGRVMLCIIGCSPRPASARSERCMEVLYFSDPCLVEVGANIHVRYSQIFPRPSGSKLLALGANSARPNDDDFSANAAPHR